MKPQGLPDIDLPFHLQEPNSCARCKHSFYKAGDTALRYLYCGLAKHRELCVYERHELGECGADGKKWAERNI